MKSKITDILSKKKLYSLYAFLISSISCFIFFMINKMDGIKYLVVRSDLFHSMGAYINFFRTILKHDSLLFNNSTCLGINGIQSIASGLFSPFNVLYLIFHKCDFDYVTMSIVVLEIGCISLSFHYFSKKVLKNDGFSSVIISVFYALNSFVLAYGTIMIIWLDAVLIVPLLITSIVDCIENDKRILMIVLYLYSFVSFFYMGYIIGVFSFIFTVLYLIIFYKNNDHSLKECFSKLFNYVLGVIVSIMLAAFLWVPTLFFLLANRVEDSTAAFTIPSNLLQIINSLFWGIASGIDGYYAYIYCGIPIIVLVPLFFLNSNINKKEKLFASFLLSFYLISTVSTKLNLILHCFDQPDSFWYRYSFIICFILCSIASRQMKFFHSFEYKKIFAIVFCIVVFYLFMQHTTTLFELDFEDHTYLNTNYGFLVNLFFILLWCFVLYLVVKKIKFKFIICLMVVLLTSFEILSNSHRMMIGRIEAKSYNTWFNSVNSVVREIQTKDDNFYRMICDYSLNYNPDTLFGYNGVGYFSGAEKLPVRNFLSKIGFSSTTRAVFDNGYNPVSSMLLGVKYYIHYPDELKKLNVVEAEIDNSNVDSAEVDNSNIDDFDNDLQYVSSFKKNEYCLNIGFLTSGEILLYDFEGNNSFDNLNSLVSTLSGNDDKCFIELDKEKIDFDFDGMELLKMEDGSYRFNRLNDSGSVTINVSAPKDDDVYIQFENDKHIYTNYDFFISDTKNMPINTVNCLKLPFTAKMNYDEDSNSYNISAYSFSSYSPRQFDCDNINIYYLDNETLDKQYNILSKEMLNITNYSNGHFEGTLHCDSDKRLLVTTIPYDPGWNVFINDVEVEPIRVLDGAFLAFWIPNTGDYNIVLDFECPGLKIGIIISIGGLLGLLSVVFENKLKIKKVKAEK